jgi:cellulose synthase/poly-beta-1,6-N-acetylglucosamine synthase-like glycosyltransferase
MIDIILLIILTIYLVLIWTYIGYPLSLEVLNRLKIKNAQDNVHVNFKNFEPNVSIIIPTYNEEKSIEKKLLNCLELDYNKNKLEIIVIDSSSTDKTVEIVNKFPISQIKLILQEERKGKASALNEALEHTQSDIIISTDANALMNKSALKNIVKHFTNKKVAGVEGKYIVGRSSENTIVYQESLFRRIENWLKVRESSLDSVASMVGELFAFRKNIEKFDESAVTEDFEMSIAMRKKGYKLVFEPNAIIAEPAALNFSDEIVQKKRRVIGTIQTLFKNKDTLFNPKFGLYGMYILPSHKLLPIIGPFFIMLLITVSLYSYIFASKTSLYILSIINLSCVIFSILALVLTKFYRVKNKILNSVSYLILMEIIITLAWWDFIMGKYSVKWEKIQSTRIYAI